MGTNDNKPSERRKGDERRESVVDRRLGLDRRRSDERRRGESDTNEKEFVERRSGEDRRQSVVDRRLGLDRHRGPGRRRGDDRKSAEEGNMSDEQFEFLMAIDAYKKANTRPFPTWTEVLEVIKALGYRKVAEPAPLAECAKQAEGE